MYMRFFPTILYSVMRCFTSRALDSSGSEVSVDGEHRLIEDFQKGETPTFIEHARAGVGALAEDPEALLVFSG